MTWHRVLFLMFFALWQGGFMFYGAIVVPVGSRVLESETEQGFVTQQVTLWLNGCGFFALAAWCLLLLTEQRAAREFRMPLVLWTALLASLVVLLILHARMDQFLDVDTYSVLEPERFYAIHRTYLTVSTLQWMGAIGLLWMTVNRWSCAGLREE